MKYNKHELIGGTLPEFCGLQASMTCPQLKYGLVLPPGASAGGGGGLVGLGAGPTCFASRPASELARFAFCSAAKLARFASCSAAKLLMQGGPHDGP